MFSARKNNICILVILAKVLYFSIYSEELVELEDLIIFDGLVAQHLRQREGENLHTWQVGVWVRAVSYTHLDVYKRQLQVHL